MGKSADCEKKILWSLIKSLTRPEAQHFLKRAAMQSGNTSPLYVKLFEWICKHEKQDEKLLLKDLGPELNRKNLSYIRHYLQNQLMEALSQTENKKDGQASLIQNIPLIRRLFQRGQPAMALRLWKHTLRHARLLEDFVLIKLLKDEFLHFEMYYNWKSNYSELLNIYNDQIVDTEIYFQIIQLEKLCFKSILLRKKAHFDLSQGMEKQLQKLSGHQLLKTKPDMHLFSHFHLWSLTHGIIDYLQSDFDKAASYLHPLINEWHKRPEHIAYRPEAYLEVVYTYTYAAMHLRNFNEIETLYHHPSNKHIRDRYNHFYFTVLKYLAFLKICHKTGDYSRVTKLLKKLKPFITERQEYLQPDIQRPLLISVAISCFVLDNLQDADAYARQALLLFNDKVRTDQARVTHLLLLLICYEMKNEWIFKNQFRACYQYFYRNKFITGFEKEIMNALKKTFPYRKNEKSLHILKTALIRLNNNNTKIKVEICHIFNFPGWITSRIQGITYREWVKQQLSPAPILR